MKKVRAYRNRHRKNWSILGSSGRVEARVKRTRLDGVELVVRRGGWKRAVATGKRNVHALAVGRRSRWSPIPPDATRVHYDLRRGRFADGTGRGWDRASAAWLTPEGQMWCLE